MTDKQEDYARINLPVKAENVFRNLGNNITPKDRDVVSAILKQFPVFLRNVPQSSKLKDGAACMVHKAKHNLDKVSRQFKGVKELGLCSCFVGKTFEGLGSVVEDQVPMSDSSKDAVDLIAVNGKSIYVIEVKAWENQEHPLRAMMEAMTYWLRLIDVRSDGNKMLGEKANASRFVEWFGASYLWKNNSEKKKKNAKLVPMILLGGRLEKKDYSPMLQKLIRKPLKEFEPLYKEIFKYVKCFVWDCKNGKLEVRAFNPMPYWDTPSAP